MTSLGAVLLRGGEYIAARENYNNMFDIARECKVMTFSKLNEAVVYSKIINQGCLMATDVPYLKDERVTYGKRFLVGTPSNFYRFCCEVEESGPLILDEVISVDNNPKPFFLILRYLRSN